MAVFSSSIILNRFGLWIADLSVTQIMQERVPEDRRGKINGVQHGLNSLMDTLKFVLVMCLPKVQTFGYLVLASATAVTLGGGFFTAYYLTNYKNDASPEKRDYDNSSIKNTIDKDEPKESEQVSTLLA